MKQIENILSNELKNIHDSGLYKDERKLFSELIKNQDHLYSILEKGEKKAKIIARKVLDRVRSKLGY